MLLRVCLLTFAWCVSFVFGSCDWTYCVAQFCPPSVGDVGYCLCFFQNNGTLLDEIDENIGQCLDEQCVGASGSVFQTQTNDLYECCGSWGEVADIGTSTYVPLSQFSACSGVSENAGVSGYTPYTPTATVTLDTFSTPTVSTSEQTNGPTGTRQNSNTGSSAAITGSQKSGTTGRRDMGLRIYLTILLPAWWLSSWFVQFL